MLSLINWRNLAIVSAISWAWAEAAWWISYALGFHWWHFAVILPAAIAIGMFTGLRWPVRRLK